MRRFLLLIFSCLVVVLSAGQSMCFAAQQSLPAVGWVEVSGQRFRVEIAATAAARELGLMNRSQLAAGQGMLFVFSESGRYPFWMKNTRIPLDLIWIDENWQVLGVDRMPPCSREQSQADACPLFYPPSPIRYALEVNAGEGAGSRGKVVFEE